MAKKGDRQRFCGRGHDTEIVGRHAANNCCKECSRIQFREWNKRTYDQRKDKENAERRAKAASLPAEKKDAHLEKERKRWHSKRYPSLVKKLFGIPFEEYERMFAEQNGCCAICQLPQEQNIVRGKSTRLAVDHDHLTNEVRALLCGKCNLALGNMDDSISRLFAAISYLQKYRRIEEVG
jgi:hypothetical protein